MKKCLDHVPCPNCRSMGRDTRGDNLGVYEDGSAYCFSCSYYSLGTMHSNVLTRLSSKGPKYDNVLRIPSDSVSTIRYGKANAWLERYEVTQDDWDIKWSEKNKALVFSFYNQQKELIFYQLRLFDNKKRWKSYGPKPLIYIGSQEPVVIVEDLLSAIKVGKVATAVPLFGSTIGIDKLKQIRENYSNIIIWLDYDKVSDKQTKKLKAQCEALFEKTNQIITEKDPKAQTTEEIRIRISSI